jgi:hypothetical protein
LAETLPDSIRLITPEAWQERPKREGGILLTLNPARVAGPFAAIRWSWDTFRAREADEAPSGYAGGGSLYLLRTPEGWRAVSRGAWIT